MVAISEAMRLFIDDLNTILTLVLPFESRVTSLNVRFHRIGYQESGVDKRLSVDLGTTAVDVNAPKYQQVWAILLVKGSISPSYTLTDLEKKRIERMLESFGDVRWRKWHNGFIEFELWIPGGIWVLQKYYKSLYSPEPFDEYAGEEVGDTPDFGDEFAPQP